MTRRVEVAHRFGVPVERGFAFITDTANWSSYWPGFVRHQAAHPKNIWILAGGLNAENIGAALKQTGARLVDVNSGVESAPGIKDEAKLKQFVVAIHQAATERLAPVSRRG